MTMERALGIDLGTTNSRVAVLEDGRPVLIPKPGYRTGSVSLIEDGRPVPIPDPGGHETITPSMVAIAENGQRLVGRFAERQWVPNAENTVYAAKRLMGRQFNSAPVKKALGATPYKIVAGPHGDVRIQLRGRTYAIPELSACVLQEMGSIAEDYMGSTIEKAVITVPAHFNDGQRRATKDAGRIAGLDVIGLINEPTAAALAYGFGKDIERRVAVYHLGGGTFDVSILDIRKGVFEVVASAGDTFLGGEDFDKRVVDWLVATFASEHKIDLRPNTSALERVKNVAEIVKCELSTTRETEIFIPFIISTGPNDGLHLTNRLTRDHLEELTSDLVDRTIAICQRTLREAGIEKDEIEDVILVGGMTRMPRVRNVVAELFGLEPWNGFQPDEVAALGAAIQAGALLDKQSGVLVRDVTPRSLGILFAGSDLHRLVEKNSTVPTSKSRIFTTVRDDQTSLNILVHQGEREGAEESELLGEFILSGLRKAKKGEVEIEVTFEVSADGLVSASARDLKAGQPQAITVTATSGLAEEEIRRSTDESQDYHSATQRRLRAAHLVLQEGEGLFARIEPLLSSSEQELDAVHILNARAVLARAREAVATRDPDAPTATGDLLKRMLALSDRLAPGGGDDDGGGPAAASAGHPAQVLPGAPYWRGR